MGNLKAIIPCDADLSGDRTDLDDHVRTDLGYTQDTTGWATATSTTSRRWTLTTTC